MNSKIRDVLVELKPSKLIKGEVGVFALKDISKGIQIWRTDPDNGWFLHRKDYEKLNSELKRKIRDFSAGRPDGFWVETNVDFNDMPMSYFINHSCSGSLGFNENGDFVTIRNIKKGEELSYDYGLLEADPAFRFECNCKSKNCRRVVTGNDWKNKDFQKKYLEYIYPDLKEMILEK